MGGNAEKTKFSIRVDTDLVELADTYIRSSTVKNRTELIENALRFYLGFLTAQKAEDYLLQSLSSVMTGTVQDSENRLARMDFKIAVELSKLSQVIAYSHDIDVWRKFGVSTALLILKVHINTRNVKPKE